MSTGYRREWRGPELQVRVHRAMSRGIIGIGTAVGVRTKAVTHVVTGNLRRSVHVAPAGYEAGELESKFLEGAEADQMLTTPHSATLIPGLGYAVEVGSWLPYACVEWVGRGHPGVTEGLEATRGFPANEIMAKAFAEEHL